MFVYVTLVFSFIIFFILVCLFIYLIVQKEISKLNSKKYDTYRKKITPMISDYLASRNLKINRLFQTKKKWKLNIIIEILFAKVSVSQNNDEIKKVNIISKHIGLTNQLTIQINNKEWTIVSEATRVAGKLYLYELIPLIRNNLNSKNYIIWSASARALSKMGRNDIIVTFLVEHENMLEQWYVIRIGDMLLFNQNNNDSDVDLILENMDKVSFLLKGIFIEILGKRQIVKAIPYIEKYFDVEEDELRIKALKAIAEIGMTTREERIIEFLYSNNWTETMYAIKVIHYCSIRKAIPLLMDLLSNNNWWIRLRSTEALYSFGKIGKQKLEWVSNFHEDPYAKDMAKKVLQDKEFEVVNY